MHEVEFPPQDLVRLAGVLPAARARQLERAADEARHAFSGRVVWHVSSTASGGGVAEMLKTLLAYAQGAGVENRWLVLDGDPAFFAVTKRLHNMLHGEAGDGGPLADAEREQYTATLSRNLPELISRVAPRDIVMLHDPQAAGLAAAVRRTGARVVWRCHVGADASNALTEAAWDFLHPFLRDVDAFVFSRRAYAPAWAADERLHEIPPSIDPFSPKNRDLDPPFVTQVLSRVGLLAAPDGAEPLRFSRMDGTVGEVRSRRGSSGLVLDGPPPSVDTPLVVQVSRWDRLKDMAGVMEGFAQLVAAETGEQAATGGPHLMLVGPESAGVADDPEGIGVLSECKVLWAGLPERIRRRIHLAAIPMDDLEENALIVNAIQRHARVVVQKSLAEGFGLTVTEAMWKARPVVASRVGGIQDQIRDRREGLLLSDPTDLGAFATALRGLLADQVMAARLGAAARQRVLDQYVGDRHLERYVVLFSRLVDGDAIPVEELDA
jgi:trehalose synthase